MEKLGDCKGCSSSVIVSEEEIELLIQEIQLNKEDTVSRELYEARLAACQSCSSLIYDTTCKYCGCLIKYKALFNRKTCADPTGAKW
jgi:hypothetical protein